MDCSPPGTYVHGDFPDKNTGVGCHALLQGIFPTQELNPGLPHCRQIFTVWATREALTWFFSPNSLPPVFPDPAGDSSLSRLSKKALLELLCYKLYLRVPWHLTCDKCLRKAEPSCVLGQHCRHPGGTIFSDTAHNCSNLPAICLL